MNLRPHQSRALEAMNGANKGKILIPEYLERVYPEEKDSLAKLKKQIKEHKEWKEKHQASYSFFTRKHLEMEETDNYNEND